MPFKNKILVVGDVDVKDGHPHVSNWSFGFDADWMPPGQQFDTPLIDDKLGGWEIWELHDIAHGSPCHCGVVEVLVKFALPTGPPIRYGAP